MTLRTNGRHAKRRWLGLGAAVVGLTAIAIGVALASIPSNFFVVTDQQGANDVPGQVDLTQMGRDDISDATKYKLFWSWDSVDSWTGTGQTGDACALFDSNGNGNIDRVVCGQVTNKNADPTFVVETAQSPYYFSCSDKKNDRCTNPTALTYTSGQIVAGVLGNPSDRSSNLVTTTDPFAAGSNNPKDATLEVDILKSILPTGSTLVNVCSYPSAGNGGNNNPFDCIVAPGGGFLKIVKNVSGGTAQTFDFTLNPAPPSPESATYTLGPTAAKSGTDQTAPIGLNITTSQGVTESIPNGWSLSSASCSIEGGSSTGTANLNTGAITAIAINSGKVTTCTFTDAPVQPKLTLIKNVKNNNGGTNVATDWTLSASGTGGFTNASLSAIATVSGYDSSASTGAKSVNAGQTYTLSESATPGGYTASSSWSCTGGTFTSPNQISLALGADVTCSIANDDQQGTLLVKKIVVNSNGGTKVATDFSFSLDGGATSTGFLQDPDNNPLHGSNSLNKDAGTYTVTEPAVAGYTTSYDNCTNVSLANGGIQTCTITNSDQAGTLIVKKVVVNDNGGTKVATDFSFSLDGGATSTAFAQDPDNNPLHGRNSLAKSAGTYNITEPAVAGYTTSYDNCSNVSLANGGTQTCTITNDDSKASPGIGTTMSWTLNDKLTLSGFRTGGTGGTASFYLYKDDATCSDASKVVFSQLGIAVSNATGEASTSTGYTTTASGTYRWFVTYSGDNLNNGNDGTGTCGNETTTLP